MTLFRYIDNDISKAIEKKYSVVLLGPRQVGKTTLVKENTKSIENLIAYYLQNPSVRIELESRPAKIIDQVSAYKNQPLVFIDEAQKIPELFDAVQYLIDNKTASFIITGSSARKLRRHNVNLLPGRTMHFNLSPLLLGELGLLQNSAIDAIKINNVNEKVPYSFEESLVFGSLPGIVLMPKEDRGDFLRSYTHTYLEEEIRAEALSRKIGAFSRFLELAASESGTSPNYAKLSNETGISQPTVKEYYSILEDTLVIERVEAYMKHSRKRILSTPRHYFFDIGVRNAMARMTLDENLINAQKGVLFEHAVMLEIIRRTKLGGYPYKVCYWRTSAGAEVDCIIDMGERVIPIEIKSSANVSSGDVRGLKIFLDDYSAVAGHGYVITMGERREKLAENITAIPWHDL